MLRHAGAHLEAEGGVHASAEAEGDELMTFVKGDHLGERTKRSQHLSRID